MRMHKHILSVIIFSINFRNNSYLLKAIIAAGSNCNSRSTIKQIASKYGCAIFCRSKSATSSS